MDKHNIVIIILLLLFLGSTSFSAYVIASGVVQPKPVEDAGQEQQIIEKDALAKQNAELKERLAETEKKIPKYGTEKDSPFDHVKDHRVKVFKSRVEIDLKDISHWTIADTNSMDPLIDVGSTALSLKPATPENIYVGDVGFYNSLLAKKVIIHRVIGIDHDPEWYSTFRGDNLENPDPEKVRFPQIEGVLIGVIY